MSVRSTLRTGGVAVRAMLVATAVLGVGYRPVAASRLLSRNLLVYGVGGLVAPFVGIKLIDLVVSLIPGF